MSDEQTSTTTGEDAWEGVVELVKERELGSTAAGKAANAALLAMSRAARSFLIYDPSNDAIRTFLEDLRTKFQAYSTQFGPMELEVRPFEMALEGDVIYLERDRERSLAFKMFRDGVRKLTVQGDVTWDEVLRLLQILSVRYTGVRQLEDDIVTLLWKAGFKHIDIEAVEGVMPDEDEDAESAAGGGGGGEQRVSYGAQIEAPANRDQPLPEFYRAGRLKYKEIDEPVLEAIRNNEEEKDIALQAVLLAELMLEVVSEPTDPTEIDDVLPYIDEVRDFLLAEEQLGSLTRLVVLLQRSFPDRPEIIQPMLERFASVDALRRIIKSIQKNHQSPPQELLELMALLPADHLEQLIDVLALERDQSSRRITRQLIEAFIQDREVFVMGQLLSSGPEVAQDLLRSAARVIPDTVMQFAPEIAAKGEAEVLDELVRLLRKMDASEEATEALLVLLHDKTERIRVQAITLLGERKETKSYTPMMEAVQKRASGNLGPAEAEAFGKALVAIRPAQARVVFADWVRPANVLKRWFGSPGQKMLAWTGVAGLELIDDDSYDDMITWLSKRTSEDLYKRCRAALVHRRHRREARSDG